MCLCSVVVSNSVCCSGYIYYELKLLPLYAMKKINLRDNCKITEISVCYVERTGRTSKPNSAVLATSTRLRLGLSQHIHHRQYTGIKALCKQCHLKEDITSPYNDDWFYPLKVVVQTGPLILILILLLNYY